MWLFSVEEICPNHSEKVLVIGSCVCRSLPVGICLACERHQQNIDARTFTYLGFNYSAIIASGCGECPM